MVTMSQLNVKTGGASLAREFGREFDPHTGHIFDNLSICFDKIESLSFHRSQLIVSVFRKLSSLFSDHRLWFLVMFKYV